MYPNGTYTVNATIAITVGFSAPVTVHGYAECNGSSNFGTGSNSVVEYTSACDGLPALLIDASGELGDKNATYAGGNGTTQLVFAYEANWWGGRWGWFRRGIVHHIFTHKIALLCPCLESD